MERRESLQYLSVRIWVQRLKNPPVLDSLNTQFICPGQIALVTSSLRIAWISVKFRHSNYKGFLYELKAVKFLWFFFFLQVSFNIFWLQDISFQRVGRYCHCSGTFIIIQNISQILKSLIHLDLRYICGVKQKSWHLISQMYQRLVNWSRDHYFYLFL